MVGLIPESEGVRLFLAFCLAKMNKEIQWVFLKGWEEKAVAELRDLGKDMAQSSSPRCQLVGISDRETEPQSLAAP